MNNSASSLLAMHSSSVSDGLKSGAFPFSVILTALHAIVDENTPTVLIEQVLQKLKDGWTPDFRSTFGMDNMNIADKQALIDTLEDLNNKYPSGMLSHDELVKTGVQVEVKLFNDNGKYKYSGIVSVGMKFPWQTGFMSEIIDNQDIVHSTSFSEYKVVISDTAMNNNDRNYTMCAMRIMN